jgi:hypothetical protein
MLSVLSGTQKLVYVPKPAALTIDCTFHMVLGKKNTYIQQKEIRDFWFRNMNSCIVFVHSHFWFDGGGWSILTCKRV